MIISKLFTSNYYSVSLYRIIIHHFYIVILFILYRIIPYSSLHLTISNFKILCMPINKVRQYVIICLSIVYIFDDFE